MSRWVLLGAVAMLACGDDGSGPAGADGSMPTGEVRQCQSDSDCDDGRWCSGVERCAPSADEADLRGCVADDVPCPNVDRCLEQLERCGPSCNAVADSDGDGYVALSCGGDDCDDGDPRRHPGAPEVCDAFGLDEDCNPFQPPPRDLDRDGHFDTQCCNTDSAGTSYCGDDCDDLRRNVHPRATEVCDRVDNDCDGNVDEETLVVLYVDADYDGAGDPDQTMMGCPGTAGLVSTSDDCDDADPTRHPRLFEICDDVDNDCDGSVDETATAVDWYADLDGDGFGNRFSGVATAECSPPMGYVLNDRDCDDNDPSVNPAAAEMCNGIDDDCNGLADYEIAPGDTEDDDRDMAVDAACGGDDCDDRDPATIQGAPEQCDGFDNDCDGTVDENVAELVFFRDVDGDGWGDSLGGGVRSCVVLPGYAIAGDCDDQQEQRYPGVPELCDEVDDDCDGFVDESCVGDRSPVVDLAAGGSHTCMTVLDRLGDRSHWCWGAGERGQLGDGLGIDSLHPVMTGVAQFNNQNDEGVLFAGQEYTCSYDLPTTNVFCWGANDHHQLGRDETGSWDPPQEDGLAPSTFAVSGSGPTAFMSLGERHGCVLWGHLVCWGDNSMGQLAGGSTARAGHPVPLRFTEFDGATYVHVGGGTNHSCAVREEGTVECWGDNSAGQRGVGARDDTTVRDLVPDIDDALRVDGGAGFTCVLTRDARVRCWGSGEHGQLGPGVSDSDQPVAIDFDGVSQLELGDDFACVRRDREVWCWGRGELGQLGDGRAVSSPVPVQVELPNGATDLAVGSRHACVIDRERDVFCWGDNDRGQLGDGTRTPQSLPARVVRR